MEIKNLTPHPISLLMGDEYVAIEPTGVVPRVSETFSNVGDDFPFEALTAEYGEIIGLPEAETGIILIVSKMCCDAAPDRSDLWYPAKLVRDSSGRIIGCDALARLP